NSARKRYFVATIQIRIEKRCDDPLFNFCPQLPHAREPFPPGQTPFRRDGIPNGRSTAKPRESLQFLLHGLRSDVVWVKLAFEACPSEGLGKATRFAK